MALQKHVPVRTRLVAPQPRTLRVAPITERGKRRFGAADALGPCSQIQNPVTSSAMPNTKLQSALMLHSTWRALLALPALVPFVVEPWHTFALGNRDAGRRRLATRLGRTLLAPRHPLVPPHGMSEPGIAKADRGVYRAVRVPLWALEAISHGLIDPQSARLEPTWNSARRQKETSEGA